jgi:predicted acyltransferase
LNPGAAPVPLAAAKPARLTSLDAYRGFIMIALAGSGFGIASVARSHRGEPLWDFLGYQFDHVAWRGCGFWDLIQPSFMFMVGVAIPYSYASRKAKGDSERKILSHTIYRSILLVLLGVFLSSMGSRQTSWVFMNVLSQIGLGYTFVSLLRGRSLRTQALALAATLVVPWLLFALYPVVPAGFDHAAVGVRDDFERFTGFAAHWNKNANVASNFDLLFLNLFPPHDFKFNSGGYQTLNFIPAMGTMLIGLLAGELLRGDQPAATKLRWLLGAGAACLALGAALDPQILWAVHGGWVIAPIVKRLWTPSWTVFSSGWTLLLLAAFYFVIDIRGYRRWTFPLVVVGMNSMAIYMMAQLMRGWARQVIETHAGRSMFTGGYGPIWSSLAVLLAFWLICLWMYRRKIFLRL